MCGILGVKVRNGASEVLLKGIKSLEYRGYDSVGMALIDNDMIKVRKGLGKVDEVDSGVDFGSMRGNLGITHTRWSTHGKPSMENSHPHLSNNGKIAVVHNGIVENYKGLREKLIALGYDFKSETDSEVIPNLIEEFMKEHCFKGSFVKCLNELTGTFAIVAIEVESGKMIGARRMSPLVFGSGENGVYLSSDVNGFIEHTNNVLFLEDNEMVVIDEKGFNLSNFVTGEIVDRSFEQINWDYEDSLKGEFEHYMLKEIFEQPDALKRTFEGRITDGRVSFGDFRLDEGYLRGVGRIIILGCGTSYYAGHVGKFYIESLAKLPVEVDYASEFRYRNPVINSNDLVIAISQSGETVDTLAGIREAKSKGAKVLSICNVRNSSIPRESDETIYTMAGPEIGVASTKAFICQLGVLYMFGVYLAQVFGSWDKGHLAEGVNDFLKVPELINEILEDTEKIKEISHFYHEKNNAFYLGRGTNYPIALEGALKLKEVSYVHAEGYPAAELKHGPIALIDKDMPVFVVAVKDSSYSKIKSNIEEIKSRGGIIISLASEGDDEIITISDRVIYLPKTSGLLYPFLTVIPFQLLAYYVAKYRGCNIDKPRSLAKSVTVE